MSEQGNGPDEARKNFYLTDSAKIKKAIAKLFNEFNKDSGADVARFRAKIYALKAAADVFKDEKTFEIERRLDELEKLAAREKRK